MGGAMGMGPGGPGAQPGNPFQSEENGASLKKLRERFGAKAEAKPAETPEAKPEEKPQTPPEAKPEEKPAEQPKQP
jgi:hypothetical protein